MLGPMPKPWSHSSLAVLLSSLLGFTNGKEQAQVFFTTNYSVDQNLKDGHSPFALRSCFSRESWCSRSLSFFR